jgi:hypothetical protein
MKIFCIGFHKTGTSSLGDALEMLGYKVKGPSSIDNENIGEQIDAIAAKWLPKFDAFQDNPWPIIYQELDAQYPGSRFILTIRDTDKWLSSAVRHFGTRPTAMRKWIYGENYGSPKGHEAIYRERYDRHNREVREYFKDRPDDLLVIDLTQADDAWSQLCPFLGKAIPDTPFPHSNKASTREQHPQKTGLFKRLEKSIRKKFQ